MLVEPPCFYESAALHLRKSMVAQLLDLLETLILLRVLIDSIPLLWGGGLQPAGGKMNCGIHGNNQLQPDIRLRGRCIAS